MLNINYLFTKSEVFTGKSQTEPLRYWPRDTKIDMATRGLRFSHKDWMCEVTNKLFIIWLFALFLQAPNQPVGIAGE